MFNSSTRKDDVSLKLRSQSFLNLRNAKQQTKALEAESRRMEDRLQELKVAMTREKEEREAQGGGFWQKGQTGNLSNYAQDVLKKPKKGSSASSNREKSSKKGRVKVLKDEPILVPDRNKAPGTMGNIAQRNLFSSKEKIKGPKCGQCEQKAANVSCQECGEDYCAGCFAAFHLRGALKKHRSVPVGNMGMRPNMTPRTTSSDNNPSQKNSACSVRPGHEDDNYRNKNYAVHDHHSPVGSRHDGDNVLLRGDYDEQANAAEFAAALAAWRTSKAEPEQPATPKVQPKLRTIGPRTVPHHAASADSGTSTQEVEKPALEIRFKSSLTYAERLLLKRNRRIERGMSHATPPSVEQQNEHTASPTSVKFQNVNVCLGEEEFEGHVTLDDVMEMVTPHDSAPHDVDPFKESAHMMPGRLEPFYHTTQSHLAGDLETTQWSDEEVERSESRISIIMVNENVPAHQLRGYEQSSNYEVMEGPDNTIYHKNQSSVSPDVQHTRYAFATPPTSGRPSPSGRRSACMRRSYTVSPISAALKANKENLDDLDTQLTISQNVLLQKKNGDQSTRQTPINSARISAKTSAQSVKSEKKERPVSRTKSRTASQAAYRPSSGQLGSARPGSRAKSRTYMYGEGLLTKGPSESLKDVARLAGQAAALQYQKVDLSSFFTVGVKPAPVLDRVLTLRGQRTKQPEAGIEKWRVSNKLYTMGPRSWRPDSSLGNNVDGQQVADYVQDQGVAALEQMSNDIMGDALTPYDREQSTLSWSYSEHVLGDTKPEGRLQQMSTTRKSWQMSAVMPEQYSTVPEPSATPTRYPIAERYLTAEPASSVHTSTRTSRERSMYMQEKRDQAFQQSPSEDIVSADLPRPSSGLRPNPLGASGSRSSTPNIHTPRPNSRGVVRPDSGRPGSRTPVINHSNSSLYMIPSSLHGVYEGRMTPSRPISVSGRESRAIVIDGDDLTRFDELAMHEDDADDEEAIGQLEWELASQEGRLTADGQISRMSVIDPDPEIYIPEDTSPCSDLDSMPPPHQDVLERQIRESVLMDDFAEMEDQFMADEVAALH